MINMKQFRGPQTSILGHKVATPVGLGTLPKQQRFHFGGEVASAQAAKELGQVCVVDAARSSLPLKDIME